MGSKPRADNLVKLFRPSRSKPRMAPASTRFSSRKFEAQIQLRTPAAHERVPERTRRAARRRRETCTIPCITPENADSSPPQRLSASPLDILFSSATPFESARDGGSDHNNVYAIGTEKVAQFGERGFDVRRISWGLTLMKRVEMPAITCSKAARCRSASARARNCKPKPIRIPTRTTDAGIEQKLGNRVPRCGKRADGSRTTERTARCSLLDRQCEQGFERCVRLRQKLAQQAPMREQRLRQRSSLSGTRSAASASNCCSTSPAVVGDVSSVRRSMAADSVVTCGGTGPLYPKP